eukprot:CAMPEP_0172634248 /NCGR_PEP_ID=MMETSP1068-20121228/193575_1 /TAXON_ID=35684 /ORGANISM="Pseudopedinella elastica, Strain CCMP716" /LENGTH=43 /DNA_ID= /DNA_START= /DNA_END= /DNA_ORIENTATION=
MPPVTPKTDWRVTIKAHQVGPMKKPATKSAKVSPEPTDDKGSW